MSTEENKALVRRISLEGFNQGNPAVLDEVVAADAFDHSPAPGLPPGPEGYKQFILILRAAFPDLEYTIDQQLAEGDMVATRVTGHGTHLGEFMGIPPTGKRVTWTQTHLSRMVAGKLVEHWADVDQLGMLQQLGVIPALGPSPD
jgi:predicted ester cyclase